MSEVFTESVNSILAKHLNYASEGLKYGHYVYALEVLRALLEREPHEPEVRRLFHKAKRSIYNEFRLFKKIIYKILFLFFLIKNSLNLKKKPEILLKSFEETLEFSPNSKLVLNYIVRAAEELKLDMLVLSTLEEMHDLFPHDVKISIRLGEAYLQRGYPQKAIELGESILALNSMNSEILNLVQRAALSISLNRRAV